MSIIIGAQNEMDKKIEYFEEKLREIQRLKQEVMMKEGQFNDEFGPWMQKIMGTENFTILEVFKKARELK